MLDRLFQEVLDCAEQYSITATPTMERRQALLGRASDLLAQWVSEGGRQTKLETLDLHVRPGGRQAYFGPVPWLRMYSPRYSPRATEGFYLVYLFHGDGDGVDLSLNQGTSEWRSGKMRPVNDPAELEARAIAARQLFADWESPALERGLHTIDLRASHLPVNAESKRRVRNYEHGNVVATAYSARAIPDDQVLRADLMDMLQLLAEVYDATPVTPPRAGSGRALRPVGQGRPIDKKAQRAVELRAMELARAYFEDAGWVVEDVSGWASFDFRCTQDDVEMHAEVKGTTGLGEQISLTRNEVDHACTFPWPVLVIVSEISLDRSDPGEPIATGGELNVVDRWVIDEANLVPTQFVYRVVR